MVTLVQRNPTYNYNPDLFWDADPANAKAKIVAGPNNPVGVVWIEINKPHYGIHGTPEPGRIGYSESHGCVRLRTGRHNYYTSLGYAEKDVITAMRRIEGFRPDI